MRSSRDLVPGEVYEIASANIHFRSYEELGWFTRQPSPRLREVLFLFIGSDERYAKFSVDGNFVEIPLGYARHLRALKK